MRVPRFSILLAAYNGMRWLSVQIDSILNQVGVEVVIYVSVDKSSDGTEDFVENLARNNPRIVVLSYGESFGGAAKNFFHLIRYVDFSEFDYVSFADQDDIWLADKLITAHKKILDGKFSGYSGNVTAFWPDGRKFLIDKAQKQRKYDFLFEAAGPGCSYVLKVSDALLFKEFLLSNWLCANEISLHDWLVYAWFRSGGLSWYIDPVPKILYRQHSGNQVGANKGFKAIKSRFKLLRSGWYKTEISKMVRLLHFQLSGVPLTLAVNGRLPIFFLISNFTQLRRRFRDGFILIFILLLRLY